MYCREQTALNDNAKSFSFQCAPTPPPPQLRSKITYLSILSNGPTYFKVSVDLSICSMDKIGDGECDSENLVGFCSFDGYDCCNVSQSNKTYIGM